MGDDDQYEGGACREDLGSRGTKYVSISLKGKKPVVRQNNVRIRIEDFLGSEYFTKEGDAGRI